MKAANENLATVFLAEEVGSTERWRAMVTNALKTLAAAVKLTV